MCFKDASRTESFCVDVFSYSVAEGAVEQTESSTVLDQKRGSDGEPSSFETFADAHTPWFLESNFH